MLQAFQQGGHIEIGEIGEVQAGFVTAEILPKYFFQIFFEKRNTAAHTNMPAVRLEPQGHIESLRRIEYCPAAGKVRVDCGIVRLLLARPTKNDWNVRKEFLV